MSSSISATTARMPTTALPAVCQVGFSQGLYLDADALFREVAQGLHHVNHVPAQAVQLGDHHHVPLLRHLGELGAFFGWYFAADGVGVPAVGLNVMAHRLKFLTLVVGGLVGGTDPPVAEGAHVLPVC